MSIHVCSCMHHGVGEWHLRYPGMSQEAAQGIADKINSGMLDGKQADRIAALEAELSSVKRELETERIRLAACGVVAMADTPESAARARDMLPEYESASCGDVARRVDECIQLRADLARVTKERDALLAAARTAYGHLWHVNNEPMAPIPIYTPEKAAYAARKVLRDLLTSEQRGDAINATQNVWGDAARKEGK